MGKPATALPTSHRGSEPRAVEHVVDPSRLIKSTKMAFGDDFETVYGKIIPVPQSRLKVVQDNDRIVVGSRELIFIHTPRSCTSPHGNL